MMCMTPARAKAQHRIAQFLASIEPENAPSPPHRRQTGRPAPDLERDLAAEASRVWHEPVARVGASREDERAAERALEPRQGTPKPRPRRFDGLCPCGKKPKFRGSSYCEDCRRVKWQAQWARRKALAREGRAPGKPGRPRKHAA